MKILYDEVAGLKEKQSWDENGHSLLRKKTINNAIFKAVGVVFFIFYVWLIFRIIKMIPAIDYTSLADKWREFPIWAGMRMFTPLLIHLAFAAALALGTMVLIAAVTRFDLMDDPSWPYISINAAYTDFVNDGHNVLDSAVYCDKDGWKLKITFEDRNHVVNEHRFWQYDLKKVVRTDISETTVDLLEGVIIEPYFTS